MSAGRAERARAVVENFTEITGKAVVGTYYDVLLAGILEFGQGEAERAERDEREAICKAMCYACEQGWPVSKHPTRRYERWFGASYPMWSHEVPKENATFIGPDCQCDATPIRARESQPVAPQKIDLKLPRDVDGDEIWPKASPVPEPVAPAECPACGFDLKCGKCGIGLPVGAAPLSPSPPTETPEPEQRCGAEKVWRSSSANGGWIARSCGLFKGHVGRHWAFESMPEMHFDGDDRAPAPREKERE